MDEKVFFFVEGSKSQLRRQLRRSNRKSDLLCRNAARCLTNNHIWEMRGDWLPNEKVIWRMFGIMIGQTQIVYTLMCVCAKTICSKWLKIRYMLITKQTRGTIRKYGRKKPRAVDIRTWPTPSDYSIVIYVRRGIRTRRKHLKGSNSTDH